MEFIPAIDLIDGKCVRLFQGDYNRKTEYAADPLAVAKNFFDQGVHRLHLVDLDGAKAGKPVNVDVVKRIASAFPGHLLEIGGGIRSDTHIAAYVAMGLKKIILGSRAVQDLDFLKSMVQAYPEKIVLGVDVRSGKVATNGWLDNAPVTIFEFLQEVVEMDISPEIIFTEIETDGTLSGPPLEFIKSVVTTFPRFRFISSGGIASLEDVRALMDLRLANLIGMISGKAIYEGRLNVAEAQELCSSM